MKVIGAGLPRTATTTQLFALERVGVCPCYHMRDLLGDLEGQLPLWEAVADGDPDWDAILGGSVSAVDWPASRYYRELMERYPEGKVLLSVRPPEEWVRSMERTVWAIYFGDSTMHHLSDARATIDPLWRRYLALMRRITWEPDTGVLAAGRDGNGALAAAMESWTERVRADVPAERLLVWDPSEGWEPLCEFLEVDVPAEPLPHLNDAAAFTEGISGGALDALKEWWEARERPAGGLHGATVH